ncbi:hypothetical protein BH23GEM2_BH23GEM2_15310 [soil metagenome]
MGCVINLTARNSGSADIWLMLYDSQVRRTVLNTSVWSSPSLMDAQIASFNMRGWEVFNGRETRGQAAAGVHA